MAETGIVQLDELNDHDLLVRIATKCECLESLEERLRAVELEVARLKQQALLFAAGVTGLATVAAAIVTSLLG